MPRRRSRSNKRDRQVNAKQAQAHLTKVLKTPQLYPRQVIESAAVHLVKTSRRHRLRLDKEGREMVCRSCWANHVYASQFRVRIKAGQRVKTCLVCGTVRRFGGGPKHHRKRSEVN